MVTIIKLDEILSLVNNIDVVSAMEDGFKAYSNGNVIVPPVGELLFDKPQGDTHIKYGYIKDTDYFVIKVASGFYDNPKLGLSSSQGLILLFSQKTGQTVSVLLDEGHLTNIRTAAAGALAAKYFAPKSIKAIGILGTGIQGRLQLEFLQKNNPCKKVYIWDISAEGAKKYKQELGDQYDMTIVEDASEIAKNCNLIVTTTPSQIALLKAEYIQAGTHITAVGADTPEKQELESALLAKADIVISDSIPQSESRGEVYRAVIDGAITRENIVELGIAIQDKSKQRTSEDQISVVDLTGVAVQDIMIAQAVYSKFTRLKVSQ